MNNNLLLNVAKTKQMVVDIRRTRTKINTISILGEEVKGCRYLGNWTRHVRLGGTEQTLLLEEA